VKVELLAPDPVSVEVTGPDGVAKKAQIAEARRFQSVRIDGLSSSTSYAYRVLAGAGAVASDEGRFTTAPADARAFKFIVYGDSRSDPAAHAAVVRAILATPSDFLVHTGDMVARGDEEDDWKSFFDVENPLLRDRCAFASIGNHELLGDNGSGAAAFLRYFASPDEGGKDRPKLYGSVRWGNTRFFLLNAMDDWSGEARAWLKDELDRAANEPGLAHRFAVLHQGPHSAGPHGGNERLHKNGVMPILKEGKVDLILAGHDHTYERGTGDGIKYVVSGGAGAPLYPRKTKDSETAVFESVHHFVEVTVDGDKVDLVVKRASGSILEKCGFVGAAAWNCDKPADAGPKAGTAPIDMQRSGACGCATPGGGAGSGWILAATALAGLLLARGRSRRAQRRDCVPAGRPRTRGA
jgi:MYXO-CTERM domain-containing protein